MFPMVAAAAVCGEIKTGGVMVQRMAATVAACVCVEICFW
jgi:hypothetical protein